MSNPMVTNPIGILAILSGVTSFFFYLEKKTQWKFFHYFPPLLFIYALPLIFSNTGVISNTSPLYGWMSDAILPLFLILMLLDIEVVSAVRVMGKGVFVMPDLTGLSMREVLSVAGNSSLEVVSEGSGVAVSQRPLAGETVKKGEKFSVRFELPK